MGMIVRHSIGGSFRWTFGLILFAVIACGGSDGDGTVNTSDTIDSTDIVNNDAPIPDATVDISVPDISDITPEDVSEPNDTPSIDISDATAPTPDGVEPDATPLPATTPIPEGVMFRINWVDVLDPPFCIALNPEEPDKCTPANALINSYVDAGLGGHLPDVTPIDIVGLFKPFDFDPSLIVDMEFGRGHCNRDEQGVILECGFWDTPTFFEGTTMQGPGLCTSFAGDAACYTTTAANLTLDLAGVPLDFSEGFTAGQFAFDENGQATKIAYGYVQGFMPKTTADVTVIYIGELSNVISSFLDPADMIEKNGEMGWDFTVDYTALPVPVK